MKDEPAFPQELRPPGMTVTEMTPIHMVGLTKREYFAAMAMQGLLSSEWAGRPKFRVITGLDEPEERNPSVAELAVFHADSLILELERTKS